MHTKTPRLVDAHRGTVDMRPTGMDNTEAQIKQPNKKGRTQVSHSTEGAQSAQMTE